MKNKGIAILKFSLMSFASLCSRTVYSSFSLFSYIFQPQENLKLFLQLDTGHTRKVFFLCCLGQIYFIAPLYLFFFFFQSRCCWIYRPRQILSRCFLHFTHTRIFMYLSKFFLLLFTNCVCSHFMD